MSYTKQVWHTGDDIIDSKLNHIEQGVADAECELFMVNVDNSNIETPTVDMTYAEVMVKINDGYLPVYRITSNGFTDYRLAGGYTGSEIIVYRDSNGRFRHNSTGFKYELDVN